MDKRELILARMLEIARAVDGVETAKRNQLVIDDLQLPAILIFDGAETPRESDPSRRRTVVEPRRVDMQPVITIKADETAENVGTLMNTLRAALLRALFQDEALLALTHDSVGLRYDGCTPVVDNGRVVEGAMQIQVTITYILNPAAL